jgi:hypothetical protein
MILLSCAFSFPRLVAAIRVLRFKVQSSKFKVQSFTRSLPTTCNSLFAVPIALLATPLLAAEPTCSFDTNSLSFPGTPLEQARCLLRPVQRFGNLGKPLPALPDPLEKLIGTPVELSYAKFQAYLHSHSIAEADIGGPHTNHLAAKYFVIHDTSTPNYGEEAFPTNINTADWSHNNLSRWQKSPVAHMFVNRLGESYTAHTWITPWRATKLEVRILRERGRGLFVHTEMVQPRRRDSSAGPRNDAISPEPGFTDAQLDRLALLYVAASFQHGDWMIPAFHATVDAGIPDAHDDPQNFDLRHWTESLKTLLKALSSSKP